ncbi:DEAD/DEAH box helicase, partial [bacterium]|nr:DEAD/DEAH box helicase [bacterium]
MMDLEGIFQTDLIELFTENGIPLALTSPGDIAKFFDVIVPALNERRWTIRSRAPEFNVNPVAHELNFSLSGSASDWFYFEPNCQIDGENFSLQEIARLIVDNQGYVETKNGFVRISDQSQKELRLLSDNGALRVGKKFNRADILPLIAATSVTGTGDESGSLVDRLKKLHSVGHTAPSATFKGELRDYQQYGVNWMYFLYQAGLGGVLADDMGLGKTVQTIAFSTRVESKAPVLIVGPTNVVYNWLQELKQFVPSETVMVYAGSNRDALVPQMLTRRYVITSYGVLKNDIEFLKQIPFSIIIADEAQALKNPTTQVSKAIKQLNGEFRLALSGTPVENHLMDLWNLFDFVMPDFLGSKKEFDIQIKDEATEKIRLKIKPFVLRREKREVLDSLPEKTEILIKCPLTDGQIKLYRTILEAAKKGIRNSLGKTQKLNVLTSLLKLRQVCTHPQLLSEMSHLSIESAKFEIAKEKIAELVDEGHKVVLFSQFTQMLDIFENWTRSEGLYTERIDGSVTGKNRQDAVMRFQESVQAGVFLISLKAGGVGINLTSADYVIHIDPWWNPAIESQATDRVHRMGQKNKVFVYKLIAEGTIEEKIAELQEQKRELLASVID